MANIRLFGVSPRNGSRYPIFHTDKVMTHDRKETYRKALQNRFKTEFYLYYCELDSEPYIPKNWLPMEEMPKHIIPEVNKSIGVAIM